MATRPAAPRPFAFKQLNGLKTTFQIAKKTYTLTAVSGGYSIKCGREGFEIVYRKGVATISAFDNNQECSITYDFSKYPRVAVGVRSGREHIRAEGAEVRDEDVARLSPLVHHHINFQGRYSFALSEAVARGELRPLRDPDELDY